MKVSILIPTYNRINQLRRSLWMLERQTYPDYDVWVIDDGSKDNIASICTGPRINYVKIRQPGPPRSPNTALRYAYSIADGEYIIISPPEVMVPYDAVETMLEMGSADRRNVSMMYLLSYQHMLHVDEMGWKSRGLGVFKNFSDFWEFKGDWGYSNRDMINIRNHLGFSGQHRKLWDRFGFLPDSIEFSHDDSWLHAREIEAGIPSVPIDIETYHQYHERVRPDRPPQQYSVRIRRIRDAS